MRCHLSVQQTPRPSLNALIDGFPNLGGPLCQLGLARDGSVYVIAAGWGNHAGSGEAPGIPRDRGNAYLIGVEMESSGREPWDWTPAQLDAAPRLGAALERAYLLGLPAEQRLQIGHSEYSDAGKIDPAGWPGGMNGLRASINKILDGGALTPPPVEPTVTQPPTRPGPIQWRVDPGDTLAKIQAYYNGPSVQQIAAANGISNPDQIQVGQMLTIPGPLVWIVDHGDTLGKIAAYYAVSVDYLARLNGLSNPDAIQVGQVLKIQ
ncbi:LysM peptidoglycan-binding domain-containing protein [Acaricomes phytoseiuli]|uniref:LysM peptidoglycan-binding domain-containing protein n=1 Tax=Acaricomes phytoseiuli TaxID=291968 RepID=UPI00316ABC4E